MIKIENKRECSGCSACYSICPSKAIEMKEDEEGFRYPTVNREKCINCNLCVKICPILNKEKNNRVEKFKTQAYVAYNKDNEIRKKSAAGGIYEALGEKIIEIGGVVFGACFNDKFEVIHSYAEKKEELIKFSGSKYVQSIIGDSYKDVKNFLEQGRYVLFSGTPCQIEGLRAFLRRDYENLYLVDIVCHGVPSPKVSRYYINWHENKRKSKIKYMSYREKTYGATSTTLTFKFENGKEYSQGYESDFLLKSFLNGLISRPSCYECRFKTVERNSDITLGDVWNIEKIDKNFKNTTGNTALLVHSEKGKRLLNETEKLILQQENLEDILELNANGKRPMITESAIENKEREKLFYDLNQNLSISQIEKKYAHTTLKQRIKAILKKIFSKIGILEKIKNIKGKEKKCRR